MILLSRWKYGNMEAHGSFHGVYSRKLQFVEAMEDSTFTESGNFHVLLWNLLLA